LDSITIRGGRRLDGTVSASGSKNAALPILFASLLADGRHEFDNVPYLKDIESTVQLLDSLGAHCHREGDRLVVEVSSPAAHVADYDMVRKMRAGILCLGPLLARYGEARVSLPGGCAIGSRPIDLHIETMRRLGAEISSDGGYVVARAQRLEGARILFEKVTVGGTENALMAACLAKGTTVIENAAKEPEVVDLANYLIAMGAQIEGVGTSVITVEGVESLTPTRHRVIPDRIEAGTLLIAGAITGGQVTVDKCIPEHLQSLVDKPGDYRRRVERGADSTTLQAREN